MTPITSVVTLLKYFITQYGSQGPAPESINHCMKTQRSTQGRDYSYSVTEQGDRYYPDHEQLSFIQQYSLGLCHSLYVTSTQVEQNLN